MQAALDELWPYTGELFAPDAIDDELVAAGVGRTSRPCGALATAVDAVLDEATLAVPDDGLHAARAASGAGTPSISATSWPRCSSSSAPIRGPPGEAMQIEQDRHASRRAAAGTRSIEQVWSWLGEVPDPEIPAISVVDLGIVRDVAFDGPELVVTVTPTYSGCPATPPSPSDRGAPRAWARRVRLRNRLAPAWTTDWISLRRGEAARLRHRPARGRRHGRERIGLTARRSPDRLPALRLDRHRAHQRVRLHALQGAVPLPGVPGALRLLQVPLRPANE